MVLNVIAFGLIRSADIGYRTKSHIRCVRDLKWAVNNAGVVILCFLVVLCYLLGLSKMSKRDDDEYSQTKKTYFEKTQIK